jgi:hypothetical protein
MKKYYIYHIKGKKIGVSTNPVIRVRRQGYSDFEILEVHTDIFKVSEREIELQKEYGYTDGASVPYYQTINVTTKPKKTQKKVKAFIFDTKEFLKEYNSIGQAAKDLGLRRNLISMVLTKCKYRTQTGGYYFEYS